PPLASVATRRDRGGVRRCGANRAAGGCRDGRDNRWCVDGRRPWGNERSPRGSSRCRCGPDGSGEGVGGTCVPVYRRGGRRQGRSDIFYTTRVLGKRTLENKDLRRKTKDFRLAGSELGLE